jgi:hypothetical protein
MPPTRRRDLKPSAPEHADGLPVLNAPSKSVNNLSNGAAEMAIGTDAACNHAGGLRLTLPDPAGTALKKIDFLIALFILSN